MTTDPGRAPPESGDKGAAEAFARAILDAALDAVITIDRHGRVLEFNRAAERTFGLRRSDVLGRELAELIVPPDHRDAHRRALERWTDDGPGAGAGGLLDRRIEVEAMRADGSVFPAELAISRVELDGPPLFTACIRDLSDRREAEDRMRTAEFHYRTLIEQLPLISYVDSPDNPVSHPLYMSPQVANVLGYEADEWLRTPGLYERSIHPDDVDRVLTEKRVAYELGDSLRLEYRMLAADGRVVWVEDQSVLVEPPESGKPFRQGFAIDVTARKDAEEQLRHQAFHDPLTELPNRALFTDRVQHALVLRAESGGVVAVLFVDLDDFKGVNDTLGHHAGDTLLRAVARRLRDGMAPTDTVARMGGDEFAVLLEGDSTLPAAADAAKRLLGRFAAPFEVDGREVFVTPSVGVAVGDDADSILRSANFAMYRAKEGGGAQFVVYAPQMAEGAADRLELVADLRRACVQDEFQLVYQPFVELGTGTIVGVEALLRWRHPSRGTLLPAEFVGLAEETGRIVEIGRWVLVEACRQVAEWRTAFASAAALSVSVNVAPRQVRRPGLLEDVREALAQASLEPSGLVVEITESVLAGPREELVGILHDVTSLGVRLALDDFGTGYSSLSLLQDLPVDTIKIDRAFVGTIGMGSQRTAFVRAIVDLAHALGLGVVGEGIESAAQVGSLRRLGCRVGQGFYFAKPCEPAVVANLLATGGVLVPDTRRGRLQRRVHAA